MRSLCARTLLALLTFCCASLTVNLCAALPSAPLGGFIPLVGVGLTNEFEDFNTDPTGTFFIADSSSDFCGGSPLGPGSSAYFDVALLDTGSAAHILTMQAASASGFNIQGEGFRGTNFQTIFGANGAIQMRIDNP